MSKPMPKSYMTEEQLAACRARGDSEEFIWLQQAGAARDVEDLDTAWDWLAKGPIPAYMLVCIKKWRGAQFIRDKGFNTKPAEEKYGPNWLDEEDII